MKPTLKVFYELECDSTNNPQRCEKMHQALSGSVPMINLTLKQ